MNIFCFMFDILSNCNFGCENVSKLINIFIFRVGRSITPPNALVSPATNSTMPTAAAVAAAAATAKIQALDAVASNAVLGLASATPALGISPLANKITNLPLPTPGANSLHPSIALPNTAAATFITASMFQTPCIASNIIAPPSLQTVSAQNLNSSAKPVLVHPSNITIPIAAKLSAGIPEANPVAAISGPILTAANVAAAEIGVAINEQDQDKSKANDKQDELKKIIMDEAETQTLQQQENMSIKGQSARQFVMQRLMRPQESGVIILRNMVGPEDVDETLQEEIQEECSKYGSVSRVIIFNEKQTENEDDDEAEVIVKIFVEFSKSSEAARGKEALHGRFFGGRLVTAELYDQSLFDHGDLSG